MEERKTDKRETLTDEDASVEQCEEEAVEVDVEQIMREIREQVARENPYPIPDFSEVQFRGTGEEPSTNVVAAASDGGIRISIVPPDQGILQQIASEAQYVKSRYNIPFYRDLGKGAKSLVKRVLRKLSKPVLLPMSDEQNDLNLHFANGIDAASIVAQYHQTQLNNAQAALNALDERFDEVGELSSRIDELNRSNTEFEAQTRRAQESLDSLLAQHKALGDSLRELDDLRVALAGAGVIDQAKQIESNLRSDWTSWSSSQAGEDRIIAYVLTMLGIAEKDCSYLDLGANHSRAMSNTYQLYRSGARGVLVEANPALIPELKLYRNDDVVLNCCVGVDDSESIDFYVLSGDGLSTPDKARAEEALAENPTLSIDRVVTVKAQTVNQILETYFDEAPRYLNIDLEGDDLAILSSIDWETYRPLIVSIEMIPYRTHLVVNEKDNGILEFMKSIGYFEFAFTGINSIFLDQRQITSDEA